MENIDTNCSNNRSLPSMHPAHSCCRALLKNPTCEKCHWPYGLLDFPLDRYIPDQATVSRFDNLQLFDSLMRRTEWEKGLLVIVHERNHRKVTNRYQFDVRFRQFEPAPVDSPAASCAQIQSAAGDATERTNECSEMRDVNLTDVSACEIALRILTIITVCPTSRVSCHR